MDTLEQQTDAATQRPKKSDVREKFESFCNETTAHGFGRIVSSCTTKEKLLWMCVLLAALSFVAYQLVQLVDDYMSYPVDVKVEFKHSAELEFPAITVCNINPIRTSQLRRLKMLDIVEVAQMIHNSSEQQPSAAKQTTLFVRSWVMSLNDTERKLVGHQREDFIKQCVWQQSNCNSAYITSSYNPIYGNCFTFGGFNHTVVAETPGAENGLTLILDIEEEEYMPAFTESYGAVITVHDPKEHPFPESEGVVISPGHMTSIGIAPKEMTRLPLPYEGTNCASAGQKTLYDKAYSMTACGKSQIAEGQLEQCGCVQIFYPLRPYCSVLNSTQQMCLQRTTKEIKEEIGKPRGLCLPECRKKKYHFVISSAIWPADRYLKTLGKLLFKTFSKSFTMDVARKNMAKLSIYYRSLTTEIVTQEPRYKMEDLFSALGGSLGLFTGISVVTMLEFVRLAIDICLVLRRKRKEKSVTAEICPPSERNAATHITSFT